MISKTFTTTIVRDGSMCFIALPFDPRPVFGKVRAPVTVTVNGYTYRSTIAAMGGPPCVPLRKSNREAAGLEGRETLEVTLALDDEPPPPPPPSPEELEAQREMDDYADLDFTRTTRASSSHRSCRPSGRRK